VFSGLESSPEPQAAKTSAPSAIRIRKTNLEFILSTVFAP